jgi:cytochrome c oxidase cbb3-type subunit III
MNFPRLMGYSLVVALAIASTTAAQNRTRPPPRALDEAEVSQGREIYNRSCTTCHGLDGTEGDRAPALGATRRYLRTSDEALFDAIKNGIGGTLMPPSSLPAADVRKVVAYIQSLRATASEAVAKGDSTQGAEIFWGKGECGKCHMIGGRGDILGPDLSNVGGERRLSFLRDLLIKERPHIPRGYQPVRVKTRDGLTLEGIVKNENNFSLQLLDMERKLHLFTRDELAEVTYATRSLMPSNYDQRLTETELQNLLAFLSRQARSKEPR